MKMFSKVKTLSFCFLIESSTSRGKIFASRPVTKKENKVDMQMDISVHRLVMRREVGAVLQVGLSRYEHRLSIRIHFLILFIFLSLLSDFS
jgi:hypothetical protein